jgi:hypothetical protein
MKGITRNFYMVLGIVPEILIAGFRDSSIGTDTEMYPTDVFEFCLTTKNLFFAIVSYIDVEQGYIVLAWISSQISNSFNFFLTLTHTIILCTLLAAYRRFGVNVALAFLFFCLIYFSTSMNTARQFLAMPFCLLGFAELMQVRKKKALIFLFLAFAFHRSSLFFLLVIALYYLCERKYTVMCKKKSFVLLTLAVITGLTMFVKLLEIAITIGLAKEEYMERYGESEMYGSGIPLSLLALTIFNYIMCMKIIKGLEMTPIILFSRYVMLISILLCFAGMISTFATRIDHYFIMMGIICITYILGQKQYRNRFSFIVFYIIYWFMVVVVANLGDTYPYKSKIIESLL